MRGQVGAGDGDVAELAGGQLDLAMADVTWQMRQAHQAQDPAVQRVARVGNGDVALAHLSDQRCITLAGVCPFPAHPAR